MSLKRYSYKVIETTDRAEFERLLSEAGTRGWSAVGYGVLPGGERSALLERKVKVHDRQHRSRDEYDREEVSR